MVEENVSLIEQANQAALRLEQANLVLLEANKTKQLLLEREEQLQNNRLLGGKSSAGESHSTVLTEEEKLRINGEQYFKGGLLEKVFK